MEDCDPLEVKEECETIEVDGNTLKTKGYETNEIKEEPILEITG